MGREVLNIVTIPVSFGELLDRVSILALKSSRIQAREKRANVHREYELLRTRMRESGVGSADPDYRRLVEINGKLWDTENAIRLKEKAKEFDEEFIRLARSICHLNDERAAIKKEIDLKFGCDIIGEKEYSADDST